MFSIQLLLTSFDSESKTILLFLWFSERYLHKSLEDSYFFHFVYDKSSSEHWIQILLEANIIISNLHSNSYYQKCVKELIFVLLLCSSDIESNPGP